MKLDLNNVPNKPGIYIWKNKNDEIIYVGKANKLRQRMSQYFKGMLNSYKTASLVEEIISFEYVITSSEKEALILERNYIEKYFPKYNIMLTDDKRYPYIKISLREKLNIDLVYRIKSQKNQKGEFFGPYPTGFGSRKLINLVQNITTYKNGLPYKTDDTDYWKKQYKIAKKILSSGPSSLIKDLEKRMNIASKNMQYEVANDLKESIKSLMFTKEHQAVEFLEEENFDVVGFVEKNGYLSISMLFYRNGSLLSTKEFVVEITNNIKDTSRQFLSQYYSKNIEPKYILSNLKIDNEIVKVPNKGLKRKVVNIATENAKDNIEIKLNKFVRNEEQTIGAVKKLKELLKLKKLSHILMMDNSTTNNTLPVSVVVSYRNGIKQKKEYRKYNLEKTNRDADVEYMKQGIEKYFSKDINVIPDLFIVDGGIAQVNEAKKSLKNINIIGLVKNNLHKTKGIIAQDGKRIKIIDTFLLNFLTGMQIEVDRFAKYHHINRRMQKTLEGTLTTIDGIGISTEKKLLNEFGTYTAIYNSTKEQLIKVVSLKVANNIIEKFK